MKNFARRIFFGLILLFWTAGLLSFPAANEMFYNVSIVGAVANPGVYQIPPFTRVSELYKMGTIDVQSEIKNPDAKSIAFHEKLPNQKESDSKSEKKLRPSLRKIFIRRNGKEIPIDLQKFYHFGDIDNNPYLEDGDIVYVEALQQEVFIQGEIHKQGNYEIFPSSTLGEMIELAYGFTQDAEQNEILIYRFANGETEIFTYNFNADKNKVVKDQDRIVIHRKVSLKNKDDFVYVQGQIKFPGQYPFEEEKTTLLDLINYAGGILEYADLSYVYIQRQASDEIFNKEKLRLAEKPVTDMTHIEKEYLKASWRYASDKIFINLEDLLETKDENLNIHLKKDDLLYIPDKTKTITVTGHVKFPGKITFLPNTSFQHYIEKVGGYSWHVDKKNVRIVRYLTGEWVKPDELTTLYPGDMIVVPEKKVYDKWELSKDVLQVLVQFTTLVVLINNLSTK